MLGFAMLQQFQLDLALTPAQLPGFLYGLLSLFAYSAFLLLNRKPDPAQSLYQRTFYQLAIGAFCVVPFLAGASLPVAADIPWILLAGIFPGFLAILWALTALQHLPTRVYGTLAYIEPATVILSGWLLFQESLNLLQLGGVLLILCCGMAQTLLARPAKTTCQ
jgi:drug/metabolite transporter (DMT)-like permease